MRTKLPVSVHLRKRACKEGESLYLDISVYGDRFKQSLNMTLLKGTSRETKKINSETMLLAEKRRHEKEIELQSNIDGQVRAVNDCEISLVDFILNIADKMECKNTRYTYGSMAARIKRMPKQSGVLVKHVTSDWVYSFLDSLKDLKPNSIRFYYTKLKCVLRKAMKKGIIKHNPIEDVDRPKGEESIRQHLSESEVKMLMKYKPKDEREINDLNAFLFACMTGIRVSNVNSLTWDDIKTYGKTKYIETRQIKTKTIVRVPLNKHAIEILNRCDRNAEHPFIARHENSIGKICKRLGIDKKITFHCSRHTFACLTYKATHDIYTTSKLLGHSSVATTMIYAKIEDETKIEAMTKMEGLLKSAIKPRKKTASTQK